ncbi:transcriptional regulator, MerR family [Acidovorax delafieldii 2AN]|uniref:Transcriptional regulator, MerR family n=1 Tax=Acidovorax delafieldii 2AN TaxID=573060 RepID=C5T338_ACIDE|nr:MerR family transcriptional regulator [Acidovorax delafieldii]EER61125.1 transcriptional regulator, MerR family [Acidovorax delafieldii 2AN]
MLLKVGELARCTGLTVRTLHHYDEIGLLTPSGRSDTGYRLYSQADVQRLHGIQALRLLGLPLGDIAGLLAGEGMEPGRIIERQIHALDLQITQATELRGRLALMRDGLVAGAEPDMGNWLETLALMATYGKYFSAAELKRIFENWPRIKDEWAPLVARVRSTMDQGLAIDSPQVQQLAQRWMVLMLEWMGGDMDLLERWGHMYRLEPSAHGINNAPSTEMIEFVERAIHLRMAALGKYLQPSDLARLGHVRTAQWQALEDEVTGLLQERLAPDSPRGQAAVAHWSALMDQLTRNDRQLRDRLLHASASEPLLRAGALLSAAVRDYIGLAIAKSA